MKILVLDGNQNQAVASVRSLALAGHEVWVGESSSWSKAGWSRHCHASLRYTAPQKDAGIFLSQIADFIREHPGALVLPMTEATTLPISAGRATLSAAGARWVLPDHLDLLRAFDKEETTRLATTLGIPVPKTVLITKLEEAATAMANLSFPVVLKPHASEEWIPAGVIRTGGRPRYAVNMVEFNEAYAEISRRSSAVLVQEFVSGGGAGYFALMNHGELRAEFAHRRIRDVHPTGSGSALRVSVAPDPEIRRYSLAILRALHWHGVAMVEFRQPRTGPPVFLEVNGRFWNSLPLACYSGVDFPALLAQMAEFGDVESVTNYRLGVRCRWLQGDARHLFAVWRGAPTGYPEPYPSRWRTLLSVLRPDWNTYHDLFQWNDPLPELGDWLTTLQRLGKRLSSEDSHHA